MKKFILFVLVFILSVTSLPCSFAKATDIADLTIVFTHDLHSHIDPFLYDGQNVGGFAGIKSVIDDTKSKYTNTVVLDAGDFSMGTLYQSAFTTSAIEYRLLGLLGYDAVALGNHEFDYGFDAIREMIGVAKESGDPLPPILCANINAAESGFSDKELNELNIHKYKIIKKGDYIIAVFGLLGKDAVELSDGCGLVFDDFIETAKTTVEEIENLYSPDAILCISHGGTGDTVGDEDVKLAEAVPNIDVIISGHTHTYLSEPIIVGNTIIGSCGEYGRNVGIISLNLENGSVDLSEYNIIEINGDIVKDKAISDAIDVFGGEVEKYLSMFGFSSGDDILAYSPYDFPELDGDLKEQPLGNIISDSYIHAIKNAEGDGYINVDVSVVPAGVIRASIDKGYITVSQAYEISSLGIGNDGLSGYPLCTVYLTGEELWALAEIDASVSAIMPYAQLYCSGLGYSVNTNRMFMNRVYDCWLIDNDGRRIEIQKDKLYRVASGITSAKMLGTVKDKSFGLLKLTPKDAAGDPVSDFSESILLDNNGVEVKEWKALADYLASFPKGENGISVIPAEYSGTLGRKNISNDFSLKEIFVKWNLISWAVLLIIVIVIAVLVFVIIYSIKKLRKNKFSELLNNGGSENE